MTITTHAHSGSEYFRGASPKNHYFIGSKDASCQLLADDLKVEALVDRRFSEVVSLIQTRIRDHFRR
jgi:hypothetical protein